MTVRAKFRVDAIERRADGAIENQTVKLTAVYKTGDSESENSKFWRWTPQGQISLTCVNPDAVKEFVLGKEMYIDFTPADPVVP